MRLIGADELKRAIEDRINTIPANDYDKGWNKAISAVIDEIENAQNLYCLECNYAHSAKGEINERLINEYISKVKCCDECFASVYCTVNGLRESRVPQDYCVTNIKRYFGYNTNLKENSKEK